LDTTLLGLTESDYELLKDVKFSHFQLHLPDLEGNAHFNITDTYLNMLKRVNEREDITGYSCHGHIHPKVSDIVKSGVAWFDKMMNRAGNLEYEELQTFNHKGEIACCLGTNEITGWSCEVLPNGTVILCCMDYGMEHILGNLVEQNWCEIVNGEEFKRVESGMFDEHSSILCRKCPVAKPRRQYSAGNLLAPNAIRTSRILSEFAAGTRDLESFREKYGEKKADLVKQLIHSKNICIFGGGKLFKENYFNSCWSDVFCANYITDNNFSGTSLCGINFIRPQELGKLEDLLVVIYVKDTVSIRKQLDDMGINNYVDIEEIYNLFHEYSE
jgi:hypothetical protein